MIMRFSMELKIMTKKMENNASRLKNSVEKNNIRVTGTGFSSVNLLQFSILTNKATIFTRFLNEGGLSGRYLKCCLLESDKMCIRGCML